jgi:gliding motility-associated-like protein
VKLKFKYSLIFILTTAALNAQSVIAELTLQNAGCNGQNNGKADIHVTEVNPPYTFSWNFGSEQQSVSGLAPGNYSVVISDAEGNDTTINFTITETPCLIGPETIFTPNNDSYNDTWTLNNIQYYPDNHILVFNRWGQKVFESKGLYEPWDGKDLLNIPVPDNSYYYIIYGDKNDKETILKGTVSILR